MIEITDGFVRIGAGFDSIPELSEDPSCASAVSCPARSPTGARITVEFRREAALAPQERVRVRYDFAGDGKIRECVGIARPIGTDVRWGRTVRFYYRVSDWIVPSALMNFAARPPLRELVDGVRAIDRFPA